MTDTEEGKEFAAYVGIDWADQKHAWALKASTQSVVIQGELLHTPEAVSAWAAGLALRFGNRPIAIALEQSRGSLLFALLKYKHLVLFPVHPNTLVNYRRSFYPSGAKSDPSDASLLVDLVVRHPERLRRFQPDTEDTRSLQFLVEGRRKFVQEKTRYSNRLTAYLKMYFPQVLEWFSQPSSIIVGNFLLRWPTLENLQKARPDTLRAFFRKHNSNKSETIERRIQQIRAAVPLTNDAAVNRSCSMAAVGFVRMLREVRAAIHSYDEQLETLTRQHPDFAIVDSLPGVGPVLAPRLIAVLGTQRDRFQSATELQCYKRHRPRDRK